MVKIQRDNKFVDEILEIKWGHCQKEKGCKTSGINCANCEGQREY